MTSSCCLNCSPPRSKRELKAESQTCEAQPCAGPNACRTGAGGPMDAGGAR